MHSLRSGGVDLDMTGMRRALQDSRGGGKTRNVGLFFYAGHALQVRGQNYLVPAAPGSSPRPT
jgi:uncharacterized caspase-like protein